jgi:hypothetical protein
MNNSLQRLIDGMVATLRSEVIPQVSTEFARGQAFGVIYMLNSIRLRAEWSTAFYGEQLAAQAELADALLTLVEGLDSPALPKAAEAGADAQSLEALRDANDGRVCDLIVWLTEHGARIGKDRASAIDAALRRYMNRQLKFELSTSAKPMFAEMSSGTESMRSPC